MVLKVFSAFKKLLVSVAEETASVVVCSIPPLKVHVLPVDQHIWRKGTDGSVHPLIDVIVCVLSDGVCGWQDELPAYGDVSTLGYYDAVLDREDREGLPEIAAADIHFHDMSFDLM